MKGKRKMAEKRTQEDLYSFVRRESERVLYVHHGTDKKLKRDGCYGFFIPATSGGAFLCLVGTLARMMSDTLRTAGGAVAFLGLLFIASGMIFYAMFLRRARQARSTALYITTEAVVYISGGSYMRLELSDITSVSCRSPERLARVPFDMSSLEGEVLVLTYKGSETLLYYVDEVDLAQRRISGMLS